MAARTSNKKGNNKNTGKKKVSGRRGTPTKQEERTDIAGIIGIILFCLGILLFTCNFIPSNGGFLNGCRLFLRGVGGQLCLLIPIMFCFYGVVLVFFRDSMINTRRMICGIILFFLIETIFQIFCIRRIGAGNYQGFLVQSFEDSSRSLRGGGFIGAILAWPLFSALDVWGSVIVLIFASIIVLIIMTGFSFGDLGPSISEWADDLRENMRLRKEEREALREAKEEERLNREAEEAMERSQKKKKSEKEEFADEMPPHFGSDTGSEKKETPPEPVNVPKENGKKKKKNATVKAVEPAPEPEKPSDEPITSNFKPVTVKKPRKPVPYTGAGVRQYNKDLYIERDDEFIRKPGDTEEENRENKRGFTQEEAEYAFLHGLNSTMSERSPYARPQEADEGPSLGSPIPLYPDKSKTEEDPYEAYRSKNYDTGVAVGYDPDDTTAPELEDIADSSTDDVQAEIPAQQSLPQRPVPPVKPVMPQKPVPPVEPVIPQKPVPPVKPVMPQKPVPPVEPVMPQKPVPPAAPIPLYEGDHAAIQPVNGVFSANPALFTTEQMTDRRPGVSVTDENDHAEFSSQKQDGIPSVIVPAQNESAVKVVQEQARVQTDNDENYSGIKSRRRRAGRNAAVTAATVPVTAVAAAAAAINSGASAVQSSLSAAQGAVINSGASAVQNGFSAAQAAPAAAIDSGASAVQSGFSAPRVPNLSTDSRTASVQSGVSDAQITSMNSGSSSVPDRFSDAQATPVSESNVADTGDTILEHREHPSGTLPSSVPASGFQSRPPEKANPQPVQQRTQPVDSISIPIAKMEINSVRGPAPVTTQPAVELREGRLDGTPLVPLKRDMHDAQVQPVKPEYIKPSLDLLVQSKTTEDPDQRAKDENGMKKLLSTLESFGVQARGLMYTHGPAITRYEIQPAPGVKVSRIVNLVDDIALNMASTGVRIEAPIPGKAAVGIEVPNDTISMVTLRDVLDTPEMNKETSPTAVALGKGISGRPVIADMAKMPHVLIAGATGSGKSVCINTIINSIIFRASPDEVRLILVDPKVVELSVYNGIPHLLIPVVTDPKKASAALDWAVVEMEHRYKRFESMGVRDIKGYNAAIGPDEPKMYKIIVIIDELADLMMVAPGEVEESICRLAQLARAAGIHLVIATQRPSVNVITGVIKANIPSRIAFAVSSQIDSRTILDSSGAEKLLGKGDMLYAPQGANKPTRVQGCFVSDAEVERIVSAVKAQHLAEYSDDVIDRINAATETEKAQENADTSSSQDSQVDEMLAKAIELAVESGQVSISMLQRRLRIGYARAGRLVDEMTLRGITAESEGNAKPRQVLISREEWKRMQESEGL